MDYYWTRVTVCIYYSNITKSVKIISYIKNINEEKEKELQLFKQANTDFLTGVYNKRGCEDSAKAKLEQSKIKSEKSAIMIMDVDCFKNINDTIGHMGGDKVLKKIADIFANAMKENDIVGRIGGDEFLLVILNYESRGQVESIAKELLEKVNKLDIDIVSDLVFSLSIGISLYPEAADSYEELFLLADKALYEVKEKGRNNFKIVEK